MKSEPENSYQKTCLFFGTQNATSFSVKENNTLVLSEKTMCMTKQEFYHKILSHTHKHLIRATNCRYKKNITISLLPFAYNLLAGAGHYKKPGYCT